MEHLREVFGWFHAQIAFGFGLVHAFDLLNHKGLHSPTVQGIFHHNLNEGLLHISAARFRDLWCLIKCLRYEGKLKSTVTGDRRNTLIHAFREWKGDLYVPEKVHKAICWSKTDLFATNSDENDIPWQVLQKKQKLVTSAAFMSQHTLTLGTSSAQFGQSCATRRKISGS